MLTKSACRMMSPTVRAAAGSVDHRSERRKLAEPCAVGNGAESFTNLRHILLPGSPWARGCADHGRRKSPAGLLMWMSSRSGVSQEQARPATAQEGLVLDRKVYIRHRFVSTRIQQAHSNRLSRKWRVRFPQFGAAAPPPTVGCCGRDRTAQFGGSPTPSAPFSAAALTSSRQPRLAITATWVPSTVRAGWLTSRLARNSLPCKLLIFSSNRARTAGSGLRITSPTINCCPSAILFVAF